MREFFYEAVWNTNNSLDGTYLIESRAWDRSGNIGFSEPLSVTVWNNRPRVILVPDEFDTIQGAINASKDGDTVRVRAGRYETIVQFFAKSVSLVSESGPENTTITGNILCGGGQDSIMLIRGFKFESTLYLDGGSSPRIVNNIFIPAEDEDGIRSGGTYSLIRNNLFMNCRHSAQIAHDWGDFRNNIVMNMSEFGFWNAAVEGQPLVPDYNLFWNCRRVHNDTDMIWGGHNIENQEPIFEDNSYRLQEGSPGKDEGDPNIFDLDGTRSDMGVYGGPHDYR